MNTRFALGFFIKLWTAALFLPAGLAYSLDTEKAIPAESLTAEAVNTEVTVRGRIVSLTESKGENDPLFLCLANSPSGLPVVVGYLPSAFVEFHGSLGVPKVGTQVMARGNVWNYNNMLLIKPESLKDIMLEGYTHTYPQAAPSAATTVEVSNPPAKSAEVLEPKTEAAEGSEYLTIEAFETFPSLVETDVKFTGIVDHFKPFWSPRAPNIIYVGEGEETLEIVYWDTEGLLDEKFHQKGQEIYVEGKLQDYKGTLQLKVDDLTLISATPLTK